MTNIITANLAKSRFYRASPVYQYNYGMILKIVGIDLPDAYEVDFANDISGQSITQIGSVDGVTIPSQFFVPGQAIYCWLRVHPTVDSGVTTATIVIPISPRATITDDEPTPEEQSAIDEAIAALNDAVDRVDEAVEHYPTITGGIWYIWDVDAGEYVSTGIPAQGAQGNPGVDGQDGTDGFSPTATVTKTGDTATITITDKTGTTTAQISDGVNGAPGADGFSPVATVTQTQTGATISITDKTGTTTASIANGQDGSPGQPGTDGTDGVSPTVTVTGITGGHRVTITDTEHPTGQTFDVMNGQDGQPGTDGTDGVGVPAGGTTGQVLSKASGTDYDTEWTTPEAGGVTDVQVNGTSVLNGGVANVPIANANNLGAVKVDYNYGIGLMDTNGTIGISPASSTEVKIGTYPRRPIVTSIQHQSTFYGLAKAAGDSSQSSSSNAVGQYTDAAKVAIQKMLGVYEAPFKLIFEKTIAEETGNISIVSDIGSNPFSLSEILVMFDGVVSANSSTGAVVINSSSIGNNTAYASIPTLYNATAQTRTAHIRIIGGRMFGEVASANMSNAYGLVNVQQNRNASGWIECGLINTITILSLNGHTFTAGKITIYGR